MLAARQVAAEARVRLVATAAGRMSADLAAMVAQVRFCWILKGTKSFMRAAAVRGHETRSLETTLALAGLAAVVLAAEARAPKLEPMDLAAVVVVEH